MLLHDPVTAIRNVGEKRAALFNSIGIFTVSNLIQYFPRSYEDRSQILPIAEVVTDDYLNRAVTIRARLTNPKSSASGGKNVISFTTSDGGSIEVVWFNQPYLKNSIKQDIYYLITGKITKTLKGRFQIIAPDIEPDMGKPLLSSSRIVPVYPLSRGLTQKMFRAAVYDALNALTEQPADFLPEGLSARYGLCGRADAVSAIHYPPSYDAFFEARRRLVFDELFLTQAALFKIKGYIKTETSAVFNASELPALRALPFELTPAQGRVWRELKADLSSGLVMNRLIQGDVGSGKTAIAQLAAYIAVKSGYQAVIMAPTEILAKQHFESFGKLFAPLGVSVRFLSGKLTKSAKDAARHDIYTGAAEITVGTHALISDAVRFSNLGLVITDEQHRFGVLQRSSLSQKSAHPHTLVMSATPIPRTLGLILYGDLDISVIDELPPGRKPVDTYAAGSHTRGRVYDFVMKEIRAGRQAYFICPLIEETEENAKNLQAAVSYAEKLRKTLECRVALMHGRLKPKEKNEIMDAFAEGRIDILVSTTVVEVGVNVPNATCMIIENAEQFGLSQLHQLRGRVGRGADKSYCILITDSKSKVNNERMKVMKRTNDGFEIAELDLKLRGYGDFFGTAQHGIKVNRLANLYEDLDILKTAQEAAKLYVEGKLTGQTAELDKELDRTLSAFDYVGI